MTISELRIDCVKHGGVPLPLPRFSVRPGTRGGAASGGVRGDWGSRWGLPKRSSSPLKRSAAGGVAVGVGWDLCRMGYTARFLRCFPWRPDVDCCIGGRALSLRGWWPGCVTPFGCGSVVRARPRDDGYAFPGRRECRARVKKKKKSTASQSFEAGRVVSRWGSRSQRPPLVPFFLEVHEELTRLWKAPFTARNKSCSSSPLTTLDGGAALGYAGIPLVERSVAMQLCPTAATTLRGDPCLPSRACRY